MWLWHRICDVVFHSHTPQYLVDGCAPVTDVVGRQRLGSATQQLMVVPRHRLSTVGRPAFAVHGPMVWNSLPDDLRAQQDYDSFRQGLKPGFSPDTSVFSALETIVIIHKHIRLTALCPGLSGWAGTRKVKPIWILLKQETVSGSGISWAICKSAPRSRQITTQFFTGRMPFLPPNQQRQSTEVCLSRN